VSKVSIKGADTGTGVFTIESPATNTDRTLTLPDEAGEIVTSAKYEQGGAFFVRKTSNQGISGSTYTKVGFETVIFDALGEFDLSTDRFTPTVAGYYQLNTSVIIDAVADNTFVRVSIYKNGSLFATVGRDYGVSSTSDVCASGSCTVEANGTTDYFEVFVQTSDSASTVIGGNNTTIFSGHLVRKA